MRKKLVIIVTTILILLFVIVFFKPQNLILKKIYKIEYSEYVYKYAEENEIDPFLIFAIIKNESNFKRAIESPSGAIGLMQLMEETGIEMANEIGEDVTVREALFSPEINIRIGTKYFAFLKNRYHSENLALIAYNAGIGNVDDWIEDGIIKKDGSDIENVPFKETNNYIRKILRDYKIYKNLYNE